MTDKVSEGDVADATRSHKVETKQTLAPTLEDGTLRTADDGEPNPPTGAALSTTISPVPTFEEKDKETKETKGNLK